MSKSNLQNLYFWSGVDAQGNRVRGSDHATSIPVLKYKLYKENIITRKISRQSLELIGFRQWLNSKHTLFFLSQLAALLKTGINLNKAIVIIKAHQHEKLLSRLYDDIYRSLNTGKSLSQSLRNYPVLFDDVTLHIIESGEIVGHTDRAIAQAGDYFKQKLKTSSDILTALLYPVVLGLITLGVLSIMLLFVIPQFEALYSESGNQLPFLTSAVLAASQFIRTNSVALFTALLSFCAVGKQLNKLAHVELIRYVPRLNRTLIQANTLRLCQTLNNLYSCGLPITDALMLCKNLSASYRFRQAMSLTVEKIHQGIDLGQAMEQTDYFEPIFIQLIKTGEQAANLSGMLEQCVEFYQKQLGDSLARLKILLEPILIVFLGVIIGIILVAMYLPVFNIGSSF